MEYAVDGLSVTAVGVDGDDRVIEFLVTEAGGGATCFAVHREHGQDWQTARLSIDPSSGSVPVAALEWAVEFAREYL
ncbi:hypothetical protein [Streptomyces sp. G-G2]|uniref:hypothetical protein n=1 Tax=Streptomyces sp. G-G2 TaxID=3046201 RepID=UPI0024B92211|nr:hypothetical protein [Streptomyces sp. G-G2]MDJ0385897.1 hypothetical protein [Streptomyces sp. G-G2]